MSDAVAALEARLGHVFRRRDLLALALVHRSSLHGRGQNNERLEFLGDAVLDLAVSDLLMTRFSAADEGELSKRRAGLVNARALADRAAELDLGPVLRLGRGEERSGGRRKSSILAAAYEAVIGAVYLDGGFEAAREVVARHFAADLAPGSAASAIDHKTRLQEVTQRRFGETPQYSVVEASGPDHDRAYVVEIRVGGELRGRGAGKSKKEAAQRAALEALAVLDEAQPPRRA
ncbi:MAG: ribonuclease III [Deltaproteobacteria bacterium]|nr:ribonuclease III [Deltaproteobacteria bacterium]